MKRTLIALVTAVGLVGFAGAASAAIISMAADKATYNPGETILLTITADSQGNATPADQVFVIITSAGVSAQNGATGPISTFSQFGGGLPALVGGNQGSCAWALGRDNSCLAFDQIFNASGAATDAGVRTAQFSYTAGGPGLATFDFEGPAGAGGDFIFFELPLPPGVSVTIVPEPTTAALLGLGLFGLALGGRRR